MYIYRYAPDARVGVWEHDARKGDAFSQVYGALVVEDGVDEEGVKLLVRVVDAELKRKQKQK